MNKKIFKKLGLLVITVALFTGCGANAAQDQENVVKVTPVKVVDVKNVNRPVELKYKGTVVPKDQIKYTFKSGGRLKSLNVEAGSLVKKGDTLAILDSLDLNIQLSKAASGVNASKGDVMKAEDAFEYDKKQYENMKELFDAGSISKDQLDQIKLKYEVSSNSLAQAKEAYEIAKSNYSLQKRLVDDSVIIAKSDGVVMSTQYEEGELVAQGYPVVVLRTQSKIVQVGISQDDIDRVNMDTPVTINYDDEIISGKIVELNDIPDGATRTYLAKIESDSQDIRIGKILDVSFNIGEEEGIWIPINSVLSEGEKFVYVIENERAYKKVVTIDSIFEFDVKIQGIKEGDKIVTSGMKKLNDGVKIKEIDEQNQFDEENQVAEVNQVVDEKIEVE